MSPKPSGNTAITPSDVPNIDKEVRFAVVMYGGISLAIYIYGVAQELFNLVRATATRKVGDKEEWVFADPGDEKGDGNKGKLKGTEKIYRKLGKKLNARFVVDILSGTSAGGINAVYLAKALVNDQDFGKLRELWVKEGDVARLINDRQSLDGLPGINLQSVPSSLFNNQRMYFKLLQALDQMDVAKPNNGQASPFVQELDLSITATDVRGLLMPVTVAGGTTNELRYKAKFQFHYSTVKSAGGKEIRKNSPVHSNDFDLEDNPFLAFAARCTSSIPPAFEPMRLDDIPEILKSSVFEGRYNYGMENWKRFYNDYLSNASGSGNEFSARSFADGGYLDNKPFSYATENLLRRRADVRVDRRLIYIEPSPEHPEDKISSVSNRPDLIENITSALVTLPRYETIREDLDLIYERNRIVKQINLLLEHLEESTSSFMEEKWDKISEWQTNGPSFSERYLNNDMLQAYGPGYALYHNLRVTEVLDNFAEALGRALGWENDDDLVKSLREMLERWRGEKFTTKRKQGHLSEAMLVYKLDMSWRMRRLHFIQRIIDQLLEGLPIIGNGENKGERTEKHERELAEKHDRANKIIKLAYQRKKDTPSLPQIYGKDYEGKADKYRQVLRWYKSYFNDLYSDLRYTGRILRGLGLVHQIQFEDPNLSGYAKSVGKLLDFKNDLRDLRTIADEKIKQKKTEKVVDLLEKIYQNVTGDKGVLGESLKASSYKCRASLGIPGRDGTVPELERADYSWPEFKPELEQIKKCLMYYFDRYEYFDMMTFPVQFGTPLGESDEVEVIRISPEDSKNIVDERTSGVKKLAGTKLSNFGAFFVREWRENDILWGRLDAAERLIATLWPEGESTEERDKLIKEAQIEILEEELRPSDRRALYEWFGIVNNNQNLPDNPEEKKIEIPSLGNPAAGLISLQARKDRLERIRSQIWRERLSLNNHLAIEDLLSTTRSINENLEEIDAKIAQEKSDLDEKMGNKKTSSRLVDESRRILKEVPERFRSMLERANLWSPKAQAVLRTRAEKDLLFEFFKEGYKIDREFPPEPTVKNAARAMRVMGDVFQGLTEKYPKLGNPVGLLVLGGRIISGIIQVALPGTLNQIFKNLVWLLYALFIVIFVAAKYAKNPVLTDFSQTWLGIILGIHILVTYLENWLKRKLFFPTAIHWLINVLVVIVVIALIGLVILGILYLGKLGTPSAVFAEFYKVLLSVLPKPGS